MAKSMTKSQLYKHLSEKTELPRKQVVNFMDTLVSTAYREAGPCRIGSGPPEVPPVQSAFTR